MKKTIAGILIVSLLIGVSACKKQTEKTSETEITVSSEVTSSETETSSSETSETTETETDVPDTSETSPTTEAVLRQPEPAETIEIKHDLKFLDVETPVVEHRYGALNPAGSRVHQVTTTAESLVIKSDGYEELKKELGKIFDEKAAFFEDLYNETLPMFLSDLEQRKEKPSELIANNYVRVYRADNKIVSFSDNCGWWKENSDGEQNGDSSDIYYNFFSETGKRVSLDDVVADKTGFCECIRYICKQKDYNQEKAEEICTAVMDGSIEFCLTLDGIVLQKEYLSFSAFNYPGIFHMECFQSVPKNYMLESDSSEMISWDLNDDGKTDSIYLSFSDDVISIGGVENKLERDQGYDFPDEGYSFYLAHVPDGFLLLTGGYCGSEDSYERIFRIKDDFTVEY
ncbi:MAG: hypothetical protein IKX04_08920, partial [Clostridiales bacterium]|nr:hypothetical protein [Clostridiales bacterium]